MECNDFSRPLWLFICKRGNGRVCAQAGKVSSQLLSINTHKSTEQCIFFPTHVRADCWDRCSDGPLVITAPASSVIRIQPSGLTSQVHVFIPLGVATC